MNSQLNALSTLKISDVLRPVAGQVSQYVRVMDITTNLCNKNNGESCAMQVVSVFFIFFCGD
jgi:hypothetical protein